MHFACRHRSSHNAVKLLRPQLLWHVHHINPARYYASHNPGFDLPAGHSLEGSYTPSASPNPRAQNIAVLGGGITGLATAWNLSKDIPNAKITIFEANERLGGWVDSERVEVNDGSVLFEWGPRSLRPDLRGNGLATLQLMHQLDVGFLVGTSTNAPAATNRYIYYPDRLVRMPGLRPGGMIPTVLGALRSLFFDPIFKGVIWNVLAEPTVKSRSENIKDESVGDFISRRYGKTIADNLLSALFHGIYAGNIYNLSARTLLPKLWYMETRDSDGSGITGEMMELMFKQQLLSSWETIKTVNRMSVDDRNDQHRESLHMHAEALRKCSVYTFVHGLKQLTTRLGEMLLANKNITIETGAKVSDVSFDSANRKLAIACADGHKADDFDYAVSSLSPSALSATLSNSESSKGQHKSLISSLSRSPKSVNVMVVNLYYASPDLKIPSGFGYLIPRSVPADQNPERALGVMFASEIAGPKGENATIRAVPPKIIREIYGKTYKEAVDSGLSHSEAMRKVAEVTNVDAEEEDISIGQDTASGTKLAVMLGGHWWDGWTESDLPSESEAIEMAKSVLKRHLKITEEPYIAKAKIQRDCIPQYQVGYRQDMARIHENLKQDFDGRLKVAGTWWQGGVGLNDCVMGAREASRGIREAWDHETGLEKYVGEERWYITDLRNAVSVKDPLGRR